ncbi:unnamed protein product [Ambrosiozyma monospora]|uniref:Unnamed protein product n=1 Tax=Ambrosiozyma monospora TaxID=43982 RepID=A0ACB5U4V7_AMBMO|nr:unnamed protein product [Ambrosiozyma monospora]
MFKESLREWIGIGSHTIRRSRAYLEQRYPSWSYEANFPLNDTLYSPYEGESDSAMQWRGKQFLDDVFNSDESVFISATSHGAIGDGVLAAAGHRPFTLSNSAIIPLVIKRVSKLDFLPVQLDIEGTPGPYITSATSCDASLSYTTLPSSLASIVSTVDDSSLLSNGVFTVTTVITATATA